MFIHLRFAQLASVFPCNEFLKRNVCPRSVAARPHFLTAPVCATLTSESSKCAEHARRLEGIVTPLTRIQMVVYLQRVDLFSHCSAEQMMRIANIARQRRFAPGERIYSIGDPPEALYCVVDGEVGLRRPGEEDRAVGKGKTFGVREILSDRLRHADAWAETDTTAALIDAEDFFDLLSNNIEIVKALFRQLLRQPRAAEVLHDTKPQERTVVHETTTA